MRFQGMAGQANADQKSARATEATAALPFICPAMPKKTLRHESLGKEDEM
jgi:hypothetical protein